ncbi:MULTISPECIES: MarR family winged helix-turn-helix transcriptional regulator [unclassified Streptomyces]|uniref:MarR family winged helix-turn-helix transcriptional regulator n=1 Tax=unclassified Streptomyces TaxID=2593676 RepID=UPI00190E1E53|nr:MULTISPECIES: MarR family winged helix-turn-helix transcriptional regulator [unclassified Streptomyces]MBK3568000.1 winged helix-turn-helix transcriptional regulator [Streptomyces sp. MBT62]MBK6013501.1 winged helix-turn-helix transcriptional regulator [Streptomyces sp. MBT53]
MSEFLDLHGRTSKVLRSLADAAMRRHGLHVGQNHLLAVLWERDGATPGEVAAALHVTTPTVVKMADRMTASGLLTRRRDDRDNRLVRLWLTDAGRALREPVEAERQLIEERVTADLTEAERAALLSALRKVHRSASEFLNEPVDHTDSA